MVQQPGLPALSSCTRSISKRVLRGKCQGHKVFLLPSARTRLSADAKSVTKGGERQFKGLVDVYKKTLASDGIAGLYRGFVPSVVGICVYRGF